MNVLSSLRTDSPPPDHKPFYENAAMAFGVGVPFFSLFFAIWLAVTVLGLSTSTPGSSMKVVVEIKKISRNMMTSMSGIKFNSIGSSRSANVRRYLTLTQQQNWKLLWGRSED